MRGPAPEVASSCGGGVLAAAAASSGRSAHRVSGLQPAGVTHIVRQRAPVPRKSKRKAPGPLEPLIRPRSLYLNILTLGA